MHFTDSDTPWTYAMDSLLDPTYNMGGQTDANLAEFMSRPIRIVSYTWTPGAKLFETFNPWTLFFSDSAVAEKVNHFRNMRCHLKVKFVINGNAFYYGRIIAAYNPYTVNDDVTKNRLFFEQDIVQTSQRPHILIDPTSSQGGEIGIPFIYPENWLNITEVGWSDNLGEIDLVDFDVLRHANGGTDPITITVFCWAENFELCIPTSENYATPVPPLLAANSAARTRVQVFEPQMGAGPKKKPKTKKDNMTRYDDEFKKDGLISKPASAVAGATKALSVIPVIAPYAKATEMVATKVGQIARLFGYSRPQVMTDIEKYVPKYAGNLSNTDAPETVNKLSVDSKNELTIDSRVVGMDGSDELTISSIAQRESFLFSAIWTDTLPVDTNIASISVDPTALRTVSAAPILEIHQPALCFAAMPFMYWQGTIKYRFTVVCSEYHRGRLRLTYDPGTFQGLSTNFNTNYSTIIDISETRDFEYEVKWTNPAAWVRVRRMGNADSIPAYRNDGLRMTPDVENSNGSLNLTVLNDLATPSADSALVKILVWISAGDDFQVAVPRDDNTIAFGSVFPEQSGEVMASAHDDSNTPNNPGDIPSFGDVVSGNDHQALVYQGECVKSFRDLLKRYYYYKLEINRGDGGATTDFGFQVSVLQNFPAYRGWDPNGQYTGAGSVGSEPYNFTAQTLLNYLTPAFVCRRGGLRYKYAYSGRKTTSTDIPFMYVKRLDDETTSSSTFLPTSGLNESNIARLSAEQKVSGNGSAITPVENNPVIEVEFPFYTRGQRFVPARDTDYYGGRAHPGHKLVMEARFDNTFRGGADIYVAAAEDFNLSFFIGAPVMYYYVNPTGTT